MSKRAIFTSFLLLAFIAGAVGNVLAAAFCPHVGFARACCLRTKAHPARSPETRDMHDMHNGEMGDMQMAGMDMSADSTEEASTQKQIEPVAEVEQETEATTVDQPIETCPHCLTHSQLPLGAVTVRETDSAKRRADLTAAPQVIGQIPLFTLPSLMFDPREHAPPGDSTPRHILINVFRI